METGPLFVVSSERLEERRNQRPLDCNASMLATAAPNINWGALSMMQVRIFQCLLIEGNNTINELLFFTENLA